MQKKIMLLNMILIVIVCISKMDVFAQPLKIDKDLKITASIYEGIKVTRDCKITFNNSDDIVIGDLYNNTCPGIEISNGKKLTICLENLGNVNIYGGCYQNFGNSYSCAGIYVPSNAKLVIEGKGIGKLNARGYIGAAGIGGNGIAMLRNNTDYSLINAGSIYIKSGNITATSFYGDWIGFNDGLGAGIGGGGVFNAIDRQNLKGGSVELIEIYDGNICAIGGNSLNSNGLGAGIGGGGLCNVANSVEYIKGGDVKKMRILGGKIMARAGSNNNTSGKGAGIGGGGIYNVGGCKNIEEGKILNLERNIKASLNIEGGYRESVDIGSGSIHSNNVCVKGNTPIVSTESMSITINETLAKSCKKIFSSVIMTAIGILIMLGK